MEFVSRMRWLIVIVVFTLSIGLIGWGLYSIARGIFNSSSAPAQIEETTGYNVKSAGTASLTVDGPVVANEENRSYKIEVSSGVVSMKVYKSYGQVLLSEKSYKNNDVSFDNFLSALKELNVTSRKKNTTLDDDNSGTGVCSNGKRYIVELDNDVRRWSTSCSSKQGTAGFSMSAIRTLFGKQVPDKNELLRGTGL